MTERRPQETRERIVGAAFQAIHRDGYSGASLDGIIQSAGVTKGALYHHFDSKAELGYVVVEELFRERVCEFWLKHLEEVEDPILGLQEATREVSRYASPERLEHGCPLNNLSQEMSSSDEGFRTRLANVYDEWRTEIADAFRRGQESGYVRSDANPLKAAGFFIAAVQGTITMAKTTRSTELVRSNLEILYDFLETLRPTESRVSEDSAP